MKYYITINQLALAETELDATDAAILDYLYYLCSSVSEAVKRKRRDGWTWVDYKHLLAEMPVLRIKTASAISSRMKKIEAAGFIKTKRMGRNKQYVKLLTAIEKLYTTSPHEFVKTKTSAHEFAKTNASVRLNENTTNIISTLRSNGQERRKTTTTKPQPVEKCTVCGKDMPRPDASYSRGRWGAASCREHWNGV